MNTFKGIIKLFTDGSYFNGKIGFGFIIQGAISEDVHVGVSNPGTTMKNVEAELRAVIEGLKYLQRRYGSLVGYVVVICYDYSEIKTLLFNERAQRRNGFIRVYAEEFKRLKQALGCQVIFEKVAGHEHEVHNIVDRAVREKLRTTVNLGITA